jgi:hypothetical protein
MAPAAASGPSAWRASRERVIRSDSPRQAIAIPRSCTICEVAAAGRHHMLFHGPPGVGKTMLAERVPGLLPDLDVRDALEVSAVHSLAGFNLADALITRPPYSAPLGIGCQHRRWRPANGPALLGGRAAAIPHHFHDQLP